MVVLLQVEISKTIHADDKKVGNGLATDIKRSYQFNDNIDDDVNKKSSAYICRTLFFLQQWSSWIFIKLPPTPKDL